MLSMFVLHLGQEYYYLEYYVNGGSKPGFWLGGGTPALKLQGTVTEEALKAMMRGYSPDGKKLVKNAVKRKPKRKAKADTTGDKKNADANSKKQTKKEKRKKKPRQRDPAWDLTYSVPKSVSTFWSQADEPLRKKIESIIERAFGMAVGYMEEEAAFCRIGKGGKEKVKAKVTVGAFVHVTSRARDPQFHIHGLFLNMGLCDDGKHRALSSIDLFRHKMAGGAYFRAATAYLFQEELGLKIVRPMNERGDLETWFEIEGVSPELMESFSKRREEIKKALGKRGLESAEAAAVAALDTRKKKGVIPPIEELLKEWREEGRRHGFTQATIDGLLGRVKQTPAWKQPSRFEKALQEAVNYITRSESHFTELELMRRTFEAAQGWGLDPNYVREAVRRDLQNPEKFFILGKVDHTTRYTTKKVLEAEKLLIGCADMLHESDFRPIDPDLVEKIIATPRYAGEDNEPILLSDEQARALRYLTGSPGRFKNLNGLAGTGKTTLLSAMEEAYRRQGYEVIGCSVAGVAAQGLQKGAGIKSETVAMTLKQMYSTLADDFKHHATQVGRAFIKKRTYGLKRLKIGPRSVMVVDEAGMLGTEDYSKLALAVQRGGGILVCVGDHRQLPSIGAGGGFEFLANRIGQVDLQEIGRQSDHYQRELVKSLAGGNPKEVLKFFAESGQLKVSATQEKSAEKLIEDWKSSGGVEQPKNHVIVVTTNREVKRYNDLAQHELAQAGKLDMKQPVQVRDETIYPGDRVIFTEISRKLGVQNGDRGVLVEVKDWKVGVTVAVRLDKNGETVQIPLHRVAGRSFHGFQRGYAFTTHKLQGATVDHSYIHVGGRMTTREMAYVQCSRNRDTVHLYTEKLEAGKELTKIAREHEKQELKRQRQEERAEKRRQALLRESPDETEHRQELTSEKLAPVERKLEGEALGQAQPEVHEELGRNHVESREISPENMPEKVTKLAQDNMDKTLDITRQEHKANQAPSVEQPPIVSREAKREAEQRPAQERKEEYCIVHDLSRTMLPEISVKDYLDILESDKHAHKAELDHAHKQDAKASQEAVRENPSEIIRSPSREVAPRPTHERQAEVKQLPSQESKIEHDRSGDVSRKVEHKPIVESFPKVEQESKREVERQSSLGRREEHFVVHDLSRVKLPEIGVREYLESREPKKQVPKEENGHTPKQDAKTSQDAARENRAEVERKHSRQDSPQSEQERKPEIQQPSGQEPKVGKKPALADLTRVERERKTESLQTARQVAPPVQVRSREKLQRLERKQSQEPLQTVNQEKRMDIQTLREKLAQFQAGKKQELPPPAKPEQKKTPKQEKELSPLVKQMTESRAKKLAHEIMAEAQRQKQEQMKEPQQSQKNSLGR